MNPGPCGVSKEVQNDVPAWSNSRHKAADLTKSCAKPVQCSSPHVQFLSYFFLYFVFFPISSVIKIPYYVVKYSIKIRNLSKLLFIYLFILGNNICVCVRLSLFKWKRMMWISLHPLMKTKKIL